MPDSDLVVVHTFNSRPEADLAKSALDAADIPSMVLSDDAGGEQPGFWESEGVRILVRREDADAARDVLDLDATVAPDEP
jgi:hypothetical protein